MNTVTLPDWYLYLSVAFFAIVCGLFVGLVVLIVKLIKVLQGLEPKVHTLVDQMNNDVLPSVKSVSAKVEGLTDTVNGIASQVKGVTEKANGLAGRASTAAQSLESSAGRLGDSLTGLVGSGLKKLDSLAPYIGLAYTALNLYKEFSNVKNSRASKKSLPQAGTSDSNASEERRAG